MLALGSQAPEFTLPNQDGVEVSLSEMRGKKVLIWFFPKANTPGCTIEGGGFRDAHQEFADNNIVIIGVSADSVKAQKNFCLKKSFPFQLLSDPERVMISAYQAWGLKKFMGREYMGVLRISYLLNEQGVIVNRYAKVTPKTHPAEVLADCLSNG